MVRSGLVIYTVAALGRVRYLSLSTIKKALADPSLNFIQLDPEIMLYEGAQYPIPPKDKFGAFSDSCPDRWGAYANEASF